VGYDDKIVDGKPTR